MESVVLYLLGEDVFQGFAKILDTDLFSSNRLLICEEQRFTLWADNLGLRQAGHASLDYRVRDAMIVKDRLAQILERLKDQLENLVAIAEGKRRPSEQDSGCDSDFDSDLDDGDSDRSHTGSFSISHSSDGSHNSFHEVDFRLESLKEGVNALYSLAAKIRNPRNRLQRPNDQLYKDIPADVRAEAIEERERTETYAIAYTRLGKLEGDDRPKPETIASVLENLTNDWLVRRTGIANARRKQNFIYWSKHALKLSQAPIRNRQASLVIRRPNKGVRDGGSTINSRNNAKQGQGDTAPSLGTSATPVSADLLKPRDSKSVYSQQSRVSAQTNEEGEKVEWPPPPQATPEELRSGYFTCPYCKILCPTRYLGDGAWRVHLLHDLRPYHCTYEDCEDPYRLYGTRQDWIEHEAQHSRVWHCHAQTCSEEFDTQTQYAEHLRLSHLEATSKDPPHELLTIVAGPPSRPRRGCPFCLETFPEVSKMEKHIMLHLEKLARNALPPIGDEAGDSNSDIAQQCGRKDSIKQDFGDTDEIIFVDDADLVQEQDRGEDVTGDSLAQIPSIGDGRLKSWVDDPDNFTAPPPDESILEEAFPNNYEDAAARVTKNRPRRLVLDDPGRVQHIMDRGERLFPTRHIESEIYEPSPGRAEELLKEIDSQLDCSFVASALDITKYYIPRDRLESIFTPAAVRAIVAMPCFSDYPDKDELTTRICFGSAGSGPHLKLLAGLILMRKLKDFPSCMEDSMDDRCFPMATKKSDSEEMTFYCQRHGAHMSIQNSVQSNRSRLEFSRLSYSLAAPRIKPFKDKHSHYVLHPGDVFPMKESKLLVQETRGNDAASSTVVASAIAGFSEVCQVEIDESHYSIGNIGMRKPKGVFALKRLNSHDRETFNLEISSLLFSMDNSFKDMVDDHVIQLLATFEVEGTSVNGSTYYLLFDWAKGSLSNFWKSNQYLIRDRKHCRWMSNEFYSLCLALECVHNERKTTLQLVGEDALETSIDGQRIDSKSLYGRHGDIKPENFLWFGPGDEPGLLVLSDFGLGRLHTHLSQSNQNPRDIAITATYRAPEFDLPMGVGMISRASDIFSLGCVFLEHITWFLLGLDSVENEFPHMRTERDIYDFEADTFFTIRTDERTGTQVPCLKKSVTDWISQLKNHKDCTCYLSQLLEIVEEKMLAPHWTDRVHIGNLIEDMRKLRDACDRNPSFYMKTSDES